MHAAFSRWVLSSLVNRLGCVCFILLIRLLGSILYSTRLKMERGGVVFRLWGGGFFGGFFLDREKVCCEGEGKGIGWDGSKARRNLRIYERGIWL